MKASRVVFLVFLCLTFYSVFTIKVAKCQPVESIYIREDGSIEPSTVPIERNGNVYTFENDLFNYFIYIQCANIVVDGAGYRLQGNGSGITGVLVYRDNVTLKNTQISKFGTGVFLSSNNNTLFKNHITENSEGISISDSSHNRILENNIKNNVGGIDIIGYMHAGENLISGNNITVNTCGILLVQASNSNVISQNNIQDNYVGINTKSSAGTIYHNNFINNTEHIRIDDTNSGNEPQSKCTWNDSSKGNYWDNYNGVDNNGDGVGDTPYVLNENNQDNYPLMEMRVREEVKFEPYLSTFHLLFEDKSHNLLGNLSGEIRITEPEKEIIHSICKLSLSSPRLDEYHEPYIHKVELITAWVFIIHRWGPIPIPIYPPDERKITLHVDEEIILFDHSDNVSGFEIEPRLVFWFSSGLKITPAPWGAQILPTIRVYFSDGQKWEWEYEYNVTPSFMLWSGIETNLSELSGKIETETMTFTTVEKVCPLIIVYAPVIILASILVAIAVAAVFIKYRKRALEEVSHPFQIVSSA